MRLGFSSTLFVLVLAAASNASAQTEADGCADSAIAMAVDGTPIELRHAMDPASARPADETHRHPLELAWCREDSDPRCQPISPAPDQPSAFSPADAPNYLQPGLGLTGAPMLVIQAPVRYEPRFPGTGPSGIRTSLDRPPRLR